MHSDGLVRSVLSRGLPTYMYSLACHPKLDRKGHMWRHLGRARNGDHSENAAAELGSHGVAAQKDVTLCIRYIYHPHHRRVQY